MGFPEFVASTDVYPNEWRTLERFPRMGDPIHLLPNPRSYRAPHILCQYLAVTGKCQQYRACDKKQVRNHDRLVLTEIHTLREPLH